MANDVNPNEFQQKAIDHAHESPAIVSAAAGSGKTTLLVKRVIRLLSDPSLKISADEMAVMTFTRNATKSMRERLNEALAEELETLAGKTSAEEIEKYGYLKQQLVSLHRAYISTIDAFCLRIIKENAESFDLPVNLAVADGARKAAMQSQALKAAMREFYRSDISEEESVGFSDEERGGLFFSFSFEDDNALSQALIDAAEKLASFPDADKWLEDAQSVYADIPSMERHFLPLLDNLLELNVARIVSSVNCCESENIAQSYEDELNDLAAAGGSKKKTAAETLEGALKVIKTRIKEETALAVQLDKDYSEYRKAPTLKNLSALVNNAAKNAEKITPKPRGGSRTESRLRYDTLTKRVSEGIEKLSELCFVLSDEEKALESVSAAIKSFCRLLRIYMDCYEQEKRTAGFIDFSDCERELYQKLAENGGDNEFRRTLSQRFKCVIVDEFQDSNKIQAEIFRLLGGERLFYVGDVKQSIYAFRGADPYIMSGLCADENQDFQTYYLNKNYRSRDAVIQTVNAAFSGLMTMKYGGTDYNNKNELNLGCDLPEPENPELYASEIYLMRDSGDSADDEDDKDMSMPRFVASKIKELCDNEDFLVADGRDESGRHILRRARYSDFMLLLRTKGKTDCYRKALAELGISSVVPKGSGFFDSDEVKLVCSYLKIIDNPLLDEEFLKVMMSPVYRFTAEETAQIKTGMAGIDKLPEDMAAKIAASYRTRSLFTCLSDCMTQRARCGKEYADVKRTVSGKTERFYNDLKAFRYFVSSSSLDDLIRKIYEDTDLVSVVAAFEDSEGRVENIRRLQQTAVDFEARGGGNLGDFLRFIDRARENAFKGVEEAARPKSSANSVNIMTFHGSKGLEAPVCIIAELQKKINGADYTDNFLINADKFTAIKHTDVKLRRKSKTIAYKALARFIRERQIGEELRLLYVAMTRAKEKLIMVSSIGKGDFESFGKFIINSGSHEPHDSIYEKDTVFRFVLDSLLEGFPETDPKMIADTVTLEKAKCRIIAADYAANLSKSEQTDDSEAESEPPEAQHDSSPEAVYEPSSEEAEAIRSQLKQSYKYSEDVLQQAKFTTTELAHKSAPKPINLTKPDFYAKNSVSGTEKGNAYHHCMEFFPLDRVSADMTPEALLNVVSDAADELKATHRITPREREIIDDKHLAKLFSSPPGRRMLKAYAQNPKNVKREQSFYAEINGREVRQEYDGIISIQGQIDVYFIEDDGIVVLDYKSDTETNLTKELENYKFQVEIYTKILKKLTGMNIKEMYLYSFLEDKEIRI